MPCLISKFDLNTDRSSNIWIQCVVRLDVLYIVVCFSVKMYFSRFTYCKILSVIVYGKLYKAMSVKTIIVTMLSALLLQKLKINISSELVEVLNRIRQNIHTTKLPHSELNLLRNFRTANLVYGKDSVLQNIRMAKFPHGEISLRRNLLLRNFPRRNFLRRNFLSRADWQKTVRSRKESCQPHANIYWREAKSSFNSRVVISSYHISTWRCHINMTYSYQHAQAVIWNLFDSTKIKTSVKYVNKPN